MIRTLLNSMELTESSEVANLMCTDLPLMLIQAENFTFEWTRNQEAITATSGDMNSLAVMAGSSAMGYYCCGVSQNGTLLSTFCTTVYQTCECVSSRSLQCTHAHIYTEHIRRTCIGMCTIMSIS